MKKKKAEKSLCVKSRDIRHAVLKSDMLMGACVSGEHTVIDTIKIMSHLID